MNFFQAFPNTCANIISYSAIKHLYFYAFCLKTFCNLNIKSFEYILTFINKNYGNYEKCFNISLLSFEKHLIKFNLIVFMAEEEDG